LTNLSLAPEIYFDLGCGVYRNHKTAPPTLDFCCTQDTLIVLSHWDADHWAGAYHSSKRAGDPLQMDWLVPDQVPSPMHLAVASDILTSGGTIGAFDLPPGSVQQATLSDGCLLSLVRCSGMDRNDSGFALCIQNPAEADRRWLLTGDAAYNYILPHLTGPAAPEFQIVVVPHHGAELAAQTMLPIPDNRMPQIQRLVFSFGPNNAHGRNSTSHPKATTIDAHRAAGWDVGKWSGVSAPGHRLADGDVRATGKNGPGCERLHSVAMNWRGDLVAPLSAPSGGQRCSHRIDQT
jgi:hypothetical protein